MTISPHLGSLAPKAPASDCKVVTFYQDFPAAIRAHQSLGSLVRRLGGGRIVDASSWSFGMLGNARLQAAVRRDLAGADVILVSADGGREAPAPVANWIARCIAEGKGCQPIVVALHDDGLKADAGAGPLCSSLKRIADQQHAAFMCSADLAGEAGCAFPANRARPCTGNSISEPGDQLHAVEAANWRFGIND